MDYIRVRIIFMVLCAIATARPVVSATLRVPQDHRTIQAAINVSQPGDTVLVAAGEYQERIRLQTGIILRSEGDNAISTDGMMRAKATIIDGGGNAGSQAGVVMAEGCTLDGFTITNVGNYDEAMWKKHFDSQGDELGDEEGSVQAEGTIPAIRIQNTSGTVANCIIHHNGDVGIGILGNQFTQNAVMISGNLVFRNMGGGIGVAEGAEAVLRGNTCKENLRAGIGCRSSNPIIIDNVCFQNIRAGIGCREGSSPVIRGNKCFQNRRAGIGIRMQATSPVVEDNLCYENELAGIGCRDGATPILRNNNCRKNKQAGIGCRDGAKPLIVSNECSENEFAGIGVELKAVAIIVRNRCLDNKLVAIGVNGEAMATITDNDLSRSTGLPPMIAVKDRSIASIRDNRIHGGGVAAILVQGQATISGNRFTGMGPTQGKAVWVLENSTAFISDNSFEGYRMAVNASEASVVVMGNSIQEFQGTAILIKSSRVPAHVYRNTAVSTDAHAKVVDVQGLSGINEENVLKIE